MDVKAMLMMVDREGEVEGYEIYHQTNMKEVNMKMRADDREG